MPGFEPPLRFDREEPIYTESRWTYEELAGASVEFGYGNTLPAVGWFAVSQDPDSNRLAIRIMVPVVDPYRAQEPDGKRVFTLSQSYVDLIELHPGPETGTPPKPKFRLLA